MLEVQNIAFVTDENIIYSTRDKHVVEFQLVLFNHWFTIYVPRQPGVPLMVYSGAVKHSKILTEVIAFVVHQTIEPSWSIEPSSLRGPSNH